MAFHQFMLVVADLLAVSLTSPQRVRYGETCVMDLGQYMQSSVLTSDQVNDRLTNGVGSVRTETCVYAAVPRVS